MSGIVQDTPQRESQVGAAQVKLEEQVDHVEKASQILFKRIENVSTSITPEPQPAVTGNPPVEASVPLAAWINDKTARVKRLAQAIESATNRVEL